MSTISIHETSTDDINEESLLHSQPSSPSCVATFNSTVRELVNELQITFPELNDTIEERYTNMSEDDDSVLLWFSENASAHHMALTTKNVLLINNIILNKALQSHCIFQFCSS